MKLTESKLKSLIFEVLQEGMKTPDDLPSGVFICIKKYTESTIEVFYSDRDGNVLGFEDESTPYGMISMDLETQMADDFPCMDAFMVAYSDASDGWGPLLYDVCIEVATIKGGGLVSDRTIVSPEAYDVWDIYNTRRGDVEKMQLDDEASTLTPDIEEDNCLQNVAFQYADEKGMSWNETPVSKLYRKEPSRLSELDKAGRLIAKIKF